MLPYKRSNSNIVGRWRYDVFLSFRGEDTRKSFVGHLYRALVDRGILTFKDDQRLQSGDSIPEQLPAAIEESRIAIVIFSEHYANSAWCLDELAHINDCRKELGLTIIPVFYDVDPNVVRWQKGVYDKAFQQHMTRHGDEKIQRWKYALSEMANLSGLPLSITANGDESECIQKLVQDISSRCTPITSGKKNLVGMNSRVQKLKSLLSMQPDDVRFIGIWGMGGAGKTTLAWEIYVQISNQFEGRIFVENVREHSDSHGLPFLQQKILSEVLFEKTMKVSSVHEGIGLMSSRMNRKKVLLVLDDLDDQEQLEALAASLEWFGKGSRIIITTRDKGWLNRPTIKAEIYNVTLLNHAESIQLFSLYAFGETNPPEVYKDHSDHVVHYASGLPLVLKVLGSTLYGSTMEEWESILNRLEVAVEDKVFESLKVSFDRLSQIDRKIFLDIACFFKGEKKDYVTRVFDGFNFPAHFGIKCLIQKSLIWVSKERLQMHDRIQELGWRIVREVSVEPGEHSRIWDLKEARHVLQKKMGTRAIEGISMTSPNPVLKLKFDTNSFINMNELRFLRVKLRMKVEFVPNKWKWIYDAMSQYLPRGLIYTAHLQYLPSNLQWFTWEHYPSPSLPEIIGSKLVGIEMRFSNIVQLWKGGKSLDMLTYIDLTGSYNLKKTPYFKWIPNLHSLILDRCTSLKEVHPSFRSHEKLVFLSLRDCYNLRSLPSSIQMKSLETFDLTGCLNLKCFPEITGNMERLSSINLHKMTSIQELPFSIGKLSGLVTMNLNQCSSLTSLPSTICELKFLKTLDASNCSSLKTFPENLGRMESLEELFLDNTTIEKPSSMVLPKNVKTFSASKCAVLVSSMLSTFDSPTFGVEVPQLLTFGSIKRLNLHNCNLSEGKIPGDLSLISSLEELDLSSNPFNYLPDSICQLPRLKILNVSSCHNLEALQALPANIAILWADMTRTITSFPDLSTKYKSLWKLSLGPYCNLDLVLRFLLQGHLVANQRFSILVDGRNTIPKWFSNQSRGINRTHLHLPSNWFEKDLLGFALCSTFDEDPFNGYIDIQFDLMEKSNVHNFTPETLDTYPPFVYKRVWLGFMSFDFFQLLFPEYKPEDWPGFEGSIGIRFGYTIVFGFQNCAIRPVYKEDVERVPPKVEKWALVQTDAMGQPLLQHHDPDDDDDDVRKTYYAKGREELFRLSTTFLKETGHRHARISFSI